MQVLAFGSCFHPRIVDFHLDQPHPIPYILNVRANRESHAKTAWTCTKNCARLDGSSFGVPSSSVHAPWNPLAWCCQDRFVCCAATEMPCAGHLLHPIHVTNYGARAVICVQEYQGALRVHAHPGGGWLLQTALSTDHPVSGLLMLLIDGPLIAALLAVPATR